MAAVRQQVLNWLYSILTSEYRDVNRTYNDIAQTLAHYSSLSPRTDVYTYENGTPALLLVLSGTLPVAFRGTTYRFPIALWVPHAYPREAPIIYVTPTDEMMVRPGQHVDPQGKIYHPYLAGWPEYAARSNVVAFLAILRDVFATEPPVIAKRQNAPPPVQHAPPPVPPPRPGLGEPLSGSQSDAGPPPPPPPPPPKESRSSQASLAGPSRRESGPPLPPLPTPETARYGPPGQQHSNPTSYAAKRSSSLRYESAPPLPPTVPQQQSSMRDPSYNGGVASPHPTAHPSRRMQAPQYQQPPPQNFQQQPQPPSYHQQQPYQGQQPQWQQQPQASPQSQPKPPPPPQDLLDAPLVLNIPTTESTNLPAPPVPPNPEKDILLHNIGTALCSQRQHTRNQTTSSLPGLEAQHKAMLTSLHSMQAEIDSLESLNNLLNTNTQILHTALQDADKVIDSSQHRTAPNVDELLVAPTVVANQLYELVSEERSLGDALFVLGRAVEKGRISPAVFAKMTRSLAREWYLKKALVKKIGKGMGLTNY